MVRVWEYYSYSLHFYPDTVYIQTCTNTFSERYFLLDKATLISDTFVHFLIIFYMFLKALWWHTDFKLLI